MPKKKEKSIKALESATQLWLKATAPLHEKINPSALLMGKIWTRIYFSFEKVCEKNRPSAKKNEKGTAELMELLSLCVINAFYLEEQDHHLIAGKGEHNQTAMERNNPLTSSSTFIKKFGSIKNYHDQLPLTYLIATCPLLLGLLQKTEAATELVSGLLSCCASSYKKPRTKLETTAAALLCEDSAWQRINNTFIAGMDKWSDVAEKPQIENQQNNTETDKQSGKT